jgi:choline dehydrogenase-like flavoprotein
VLESGPAAPRDSDPLNAIEAVSRPYDGAERGRSRGLGGNSARWGGQLFPIRREAMKPRAALGAPGWPIAWSELERYLPEIERLFGVPSGPYAPVAASNGKTARRGPPGDRDIEIGFSKVPPFRSRNMATLVGEGIRQDAGMAVWINATATGFDLDRETGRLRAVVARHVNGASLAVKAERFVLAAGAIETTRLLLSLDAENGHAPFAGCSALGAYFNDHVSIPLAEVVPVSSRGRRKLNAMFAHSFDGASLRSTRMELSPAAQADDGVACAYGHVSMEMQEESGFALLRDFLLSRQKAGVALDFRRLASLGRVLPYIAAVGYRRYVSRYLHWPPEAKLFLHIVAEQTPVAGSRISLTDKRDPLGARVPSLQWDVTEQDLRTLRAGMRRIGAYWQRQGLDKLGTLQWRIAPERLDGDAVTSFGAGDIFHPAGSTRAGENGREAVVDANLATFAVPNLYVASSSAFPTMSSANPTLTLMLLAMRLADHLAARR